MGIKTFAIHYAEFELVVKDTILLFLRLIIRIIPITNYELEYFDIQIQLCMN